jgi:hypothetical protein
VQTEASYSIIMSVSSGDVYSMAAHKVSAQHGRTQCQHPRLCLHYRLLTLCPAPTDPVGQSWPRGTGSVGDSVGEGARVRGRCMMLMNDADE